MKGWGIIFLFFIGILAWIFLFFHTTLVRATSSFVIVINEIGAYETSTEQWVEIFVSGTPIMNLSGLNFLVGSTHTSSSLSFVSGTTSSHFAVITQNATNTLKEYPTLHTSASIFITPSTSWSLSTSGTIKLEDASGTQIDTVKYSYLGAPFASLQKTLNGEWKERIATNTIGLINDNFTQPIARFSVSTTTPAINTIVFLNASSSFFGLSPSTTYTWNFGDNSSTTTKQKTVSHIFSTVGTSTIKLNITIADGASSTTSTDVFVQPIVNSTSTVSSSPTVVLNEFMPDPYPDPDPASEGEWAELYNTSDTTTTIDEWYIRDSTQSTEHKKLIGFTVIGGYGFLIVDWGKKYILNNDTDTLRLFDASSTLIDSVSYGTSSSTITKFSKKGDSFARDIDGTGSWKQTITPTKGAANIITPLQVPTSNNSSSTLENGEKNIIMNELLPNPQGTDAGSEWIELYNLGDTQVNLDGWKIKNHLNTKHILHDQTIGPHMFLLLNGTTTHIALRNKSGDSVTLFDTSGQKVDTVAYTIDAPEGQTYARKDNGEWAWTNELTPAGPNKFSNTTKINIITPTSTVKTSDVRINELFPNPKGSDTYTEFIELYNAGKIKVNLVGWQLGDTSKHRFTLPIGSLASHAYKVFFRNQTNIALNNSGGESVFLYNPSGDIADTVKYIGSAHEDESYAKKVDGQWVWTKKPTPGKVNIIDSFAKLLKAVITVQTIAVVNHVVLFDGSDSTDSNNEQLLYTWNFGDGQTGVGVTTTHTFTTSGIYIVGLTITNTDGLKDVASTTITVNTRLGILPTTSLGTLGDVVLSEIFPNPNGSDETEFIELYNPTNNAISLGGAELDDGPGGSHAYIIPSSTIIFSKQYLAFGRQKTKIALNNSGDEARLLDNNSIVLQQVSYTNAPSGKSYVATASGVWKWTDKPTPGKPNVLEIISTKMIQTRKVNSRIGIYSVATKNNFISKYATLAELRNDKSGVKVIVSGVVVVAPGVFGSQYFYITNSHDTGVQVYQYHKDFPLLMPGDTIVVHGILGTYRGDPRVKVATASDITVLGHISIGDSATTSIEDLSANMSDALLHVQGEITELKSTYMYVDDGTAEIKVPFKKGANINAKQLQIGAIVSVIGVFVSNSDGDVLLPRSQDDVSIVGATKDETTMKQMNSINTVPHVAETYLTVTAGGLTSLVVGLFARSKKDVFWNGVKKFRNTIRKLFK